MVVKVQEEAEMYSLARTSDQQNRFQNTESLGVFSCQLGISFCNVTQHRNGRENVITQFIRRLELIKHLIVLLAKYPALMNQNQSNGSNMLQECSTIQ